VYQWLAALSSNRAIIKWCTQTDSHGESGAVTEDFARPHHPSTDNDNLPLLANDRPDDVVGGARAEIHNQLTLAGNLVRLGIRSSKLPEACEYNPRTDDEDDDRCRCYVPLSHRL